MQNMLSLRDIIQQKHKKFVEKANNASFMIAQEYLDNEVTSARLKYIASLMKEEGIIQEYVEHNVYAINKFFPCSVTMGIKYPSPSVTILNGGDEIIIANGVIKQDIFSQGTLSRGDEEQMIFFTGAKDDGFDWEDFTDKLVDFVHNVVYKKKKILEKIF